MAARIQRDDGTCLMTGQMERQREIHKNDFEVHVSSNLPSDLTNSASTVISTGSSDLSSCSLASKLPFKVCSLSSVLGVKVTDVSPDTKGLGRLNLIVTSLEPGD